MQYRVLNKCALMAAAVAFAFGVFFQAGPCAAAGADKVRVLVSIAPQKYFLEKIGAELVEVTVLVRPGADPHSYEPRASQMAAASRADLYFTAGLGLEAAWASRIKDVSPALEIVRLSEAVCAGHSHDGEARKPEQAPSERPAGLHTDAGHTWLSPSHVRQMVPVIVESLSGKMPAAADKFKTNGEAFIREIDGLDSEIRVLFRNIPEGRRVFITFHPAWKNFADDYNLREVSLEHDGKEPGPRRLAKLAKLAESNGVKDIFVEPQHSAQAANAVAESIGGKVVVIDPLAENWARNLLDCAGLFAGSMRR